MPLLKKCHCRVRISASDKARGSSQRRPLPVPGCRGIHSPHSIDSQSLALFLDTRRKAAKKFEGIQLLPRKRFNWLEQWAQSVPVRVAPGNRNTSLACASLAWRAISFAVWASTPLSLDKYANCVGPANPVPDASTSSAIFSITS